MDLEEKYFYCVIDEFINNKRDSLEENSEKCLSLFCKFLKKRYRFLELGSVSEKCLNSFLFMWLPQMIWRCDQEYFCNIVDTLNNFSSYLKEEYDIDMGTKGQEDIFEVMRVVSVNTELGRFLNKPVISYMPLVIDIERYKNQKNRVETKSFFDIRDKGYYTIEDIFSNNSVILKKMHTGRYIKVILDKKIISYVRPKDILYTSVRQNPFFSWELVDVFKYYPPVAIDYLKKEVYR